MTVIQFIESYISDVIIHVKCMSEDIRIYMDLS